MFARKLIWTVLVVSLGFYGCGGGADAPPPKRLILISIDTCRADHLSAYGYDRETSPTLEKLAGNGVLFENAFCQVPDTTPSHASILTAQYPFVHGAANGVPLVDSARTLAEILSEQDFRTAAFVSGWTMTAEASGLAQGFDTYDDELTERGTETAKQNNERRAEQTADRALEWLDNNSDAPFFLFVHFFDPHARYSPPPPYDTMFPADRSRGRELTPADIPPYARKGRETNTEVFISAYDGEIRYVDDQIARILAKLDKLELTDDTIVAVAADHGESLTEHGMYFAHGWRLFEPSMHVPLILSCPGRLPEGKRIASIAQTIDIAPTALELLGVEAPEEANGISLLEVARGAKPTSDNSNSYAIAKTTKALSYLRVKINREVHDHFALRTAQWKYLHSEDAKTRFLFDLENDPGELRDVLPAAPARGDELRAVLEHVLADNEVDASAYLEPIDEAERQRTLQRLEELGYIR